MTKLLFIWGAFFASFGLASTCNNEVVEKTLTHFCSELSKLKIEQISSLDALPEKNLQFESCGQNAIIIYDSKEPYKIMRYPQRSWNNNNVEYGRGISLFLELTKEALSTKKLVSASVPYGAISLEIQKTHFVMACQGLEKSYPYLIATAYLQSKSKELVAPLIFKTPEYSMYKKLYDLLMDVRVPSVDKFAAFEQVYEKMTDSAIEKLVNNLSINKDLVVAFLKSDDTKKRLFQLLSFRFTNEKISLDDAVGSIQIITDSLFTDAPLMDIANKAMIELEQIKKENLDIKIKLKSAEEKVQVLGKTNNYTYAVAGCALFLLTSIGFLIALIKK